MIICSNFFEVTPGWESLSSFSSALLTLWSDVNTASRCKVKASAISLFDLRLLLSFLIGGICYWGWLGFLVAFHEKNSVSLLGVRFSKYSWIYSFFFRSFINFWFLAFFIVIGLIIPILCHIFLNLGIASIIDLMTIVQFFYFVVE